MKYICVMGLLAAALASCAGNSDDRTSTGDSIVREKVLSYDFERIRLLTDKRAFTPAEQDFMIDQYEVFCRETSGMDRTGLSGYFREKGSDSTVILYVVMDVATSKSLDAEQRTRVDSLNDKYRPLLDNVE